MRLAISNIAWKPEEERRVCALMRRYGVKGVEIAPSKVWDAPTEVGQGEGRRYRKVWNELGIEIVALQALLFGRDDLRLFDTKEKREEQLAYLSCLFRLAQALGAEVLVYGSPKNRQRGDISERQAFEIASEFFAKAGQAAQQHGVTLCIEPNPPEYQCDFVTSSREALRLVESVASPGFGLHLDTAAMHLVGEDVSAVLTESAGQMRHFHVSEPFLSHVRRGGKVSLRPHFESLRAVNYGNWISIEMKEPDPEGSNAEAIGETLAYVSEAVKAVFGE